MPPATQTSRRLRRSSTAALRVSNRPHRVVPVYAQRRPPSHRRLRAKTRIWHHPTADLQPRRLRLLSDWTSVPFVLHTRPSQQSIPKATSGHHHLPLSSTTATCATLSCGKRLLTTFRAHTEARPWQTPRTRCRRVPTIILRAQSTQTTRSRHPIPNTQPLPPLFRRRRFCTSSSSISSSPVTLPSVSPHLSSSTTLHLHHN